jgi:hypothetical protein
MAARIFISYRRDDDPSGAARLRDGLAARFGEANLFTDVDNLLAGQRFDVELAKALGQCDVLIAVVGPRWLELLAAKADSDGRDYVREEIAEALRRRIVVIPVRVGRGGRLPALPRAADLPDDIRDLVHYQKHDVVHERFGRDIAGLIEAIEIVRGRTRGAGAAICAVPWGWIGATALAVSALGYGWAWTSGIPLPPFTGSAEVRRRGADAPGQTPPRPEAAAEASRKADVEARAKAEEERRRVEVAARAAA